MWVSCLNKSAYIIIILLMALAIGLPFFNGVSATTYVGDIPNGEAIWTAENSPYALTNNLVIGSGETLNIEPGVVVHLNGYQIQVYGYLNTQGSSNNKIYFFSDGFSNSQIIFKSQSDQTCTVDYGVFYSVPITIEGGAPTLANSYFTGTSNGAVITINSGAATITGNVISTQNAQDGIHINSGLVTISGNTISGPRAQQGCGIYNTGSTAPITANKITNFYSGIYTTEPVTIQQNVIMNNVNDGVVTENTADATISNNAIAYNNVGISRDANIQNNTISHNTYGLWGQTSVSTIRYNNILDSTSENVHLTDAGANVDAAYNWWGTTNETSIRLTISDYRFDPDLGNLTFKPFLTQSANAPAVPASIVVPTPPPTPTASTAPSPTETTNSTATPTPTTIIVTPTYTPYPYQTTPWPTQTTQPIQPTGESGLGGFSLNDITTAAVIVAAVCLAVTIVVVLNRRFGQADRQQVKP